MGIADRDYLRARQPDGRRPGRWSFRFGAWSGTTWLILICLLFYGVDQFMPASTYQPVLAGASEPDLTFDVGAEPVVRRDPLGRPVWAEQDVFQETPFGATKVGTLILSYLPPLKYYLHYSTLKGFLGFEYWRFIGFQFLHANLHHLVVNMIGLFIFGPIVEEALGRKRFLAFYLLCGIFGALLFSFLNLLGYIALSRGMTVQIPGLLLYFPSVPLIGASASVFGVIVAGAILEPRSVIWVLILPMRLPILAVALVAVALAVVLFGGPNAGGQASHLGGAIAGWYFIRHPQHLHGFFDILGYADPTSHHYRGRKRERLLQSGQSVRPSDAQIDRILDKITASGLSSLTPEEKRLLNDANRSR